MREAIGGGWLLGFVVLFIVLFSGYLAVSINYTKAFKVKNEIINIIEKKEGFTESKKQHLETLSIEELKKDSSAEAAALVALKSLAYYTVKSVKCDKATQGCAQTGGYCLKRVKTDKEGSYYKVTTFLRFEFPIIEFSVDIPIVGETKMIYYDQGKDPC